MPDKYAFFIYFFLQKEKLFVSSISQTSLKSIARLVLLSISKASLVRKQVTPSTRESKARRNDLWQSYNNNNNKNRIHEYITIEKWIFLIYFWLMNVRFSLTKENIFTWLLKRSEKAVYLEVPFNAMAQNVSVCECTARVVVVAGPGFKPKQKHPFLWLLHILLMKIAVIFDSELYNFR